MKRCHVCCNRIPWYSRTCSHCEAKKREKYNLAYNDDVKITKGFYKGQKGKAIKMIKEEISVSMSSYTRISYKIKVKGLSIPIMIVRGDAEKIDQFTHHIPQR